MKHQVVRVPKSTCSRRRLLAALAVAPFAVAGCGALDSLSGAVPGILTRPPRQTVVVYPGPFNALRPVMHRLPTDTEKTFNLISVSDLELGRAVQPLTTPSVTAYASLIEAIGRKTPVDLVVFDPGRLGPLAETGTLLDLNSVLRGEAWYRRDEFWPTVLDAGSYRGKQLGIPIEVGIEVLAYNPRRFQQAGVQLPAATWSWGDLLDAARRMTTIARSGTVFASNWGMVVQPGAPNVVGLAWQNGARVISDDAKNVSVTEPGMLQALKLLASFVGPSGVAPSPERLHGGQGGNSDSSLLLGSGQAAMQVSFVTGSAAGHWWSGSIMAPNVAIGPVPRGPERIVFGAVTTLIGIAAQSTDTPAAAAALKLLSDTSREAIWPPARRNGVAMGKANQLFTPNEEAIFLDSLANVRVAPAGLPPGLWNVLANQLATPILNGATNFTEIDHTAQGFVDQLINFRPPPPPTIPASS